MSGKERRLYLISGRRDSQRTWGDVWSYDLDARTWTPRFARTVAPGAPALNETLPQSVLAVGYDSTTKRMIVLDEVSGAGLSFARLLLLDTANETIRVLLTVPRVGAFDRFSLSPDGTGAFVLIAGTQTAWQAFRLTLTLQGKVKWTGHAHGIGRMIGPAIHVAGGLFQPVLREGEHEFLRVAPDTKHALGCKSL